MTSFVVPAELQYVSGKLQPSVPSEANYRRFQPSNGSTFNSGTNNQTRITLSSQGYLSPSESHLQFTITDTSAAAEIMMADTSAYAFIDTLIIYSSGKEVQRLDNANLLMNLMMDTSPQDFRDTVGNLAMGTAVTKYQGFVAESDGTPINGDDIAAGLINVVPRCVLQKDNINDAPQIAAAGSRSFAIPLIGLLGQHMLLPLQYLNNVEIVIYWADGPTGMVTFDEASTATSAQVSYNVSAVEYHGKILSFDAEFEARMQELITLGQLQISTHNWRSQVFSASNAADVSIQLGEKYASLRSIVAVQRLSARITGSAAGSAAEFWNGRDLNGVDSFQVRIGNTQYPQSRVDVTATNSGELFSHLLMALGKPLSSVASAAMDGDNFQIAGTVDFTAAGDGVGYVPRKKGTFAIGLNLDSFSDTQSGIDTLSHNLNTILEIKGTTMADAQWVVYTLSDSTFTVGTDGVLYVSR